MPAAFIQLLYNFAAITLKTADYLCLISALIQISEN